MGDHDLFNDDLNMFRSVEANTISLTASTGDLFIDESFSAFSDWRFATSRKRVVCSISLYRRVPNTLEQFVE